MGAMHRMGLEETEIEASREEISRLRSLVSELTEERNALRQTARELDQQLSSMTARLGLAQQAAAVLLAENETSAQRDKAADWLAMALWPNGLPEGVTGYRAWKEADMADLQERLDIAIGQMESACKENEALREQVTALTAQVRSADLAAQEESRRRQEAERNLDLARTDREVLAQRAKALYEALEQERRNGQHAILPYNVPSVRQCPEHGGIAVTPPCPLCDL